MLKWIQQGFDLAMELARQLGKSWKITCSNDKTGDDQIVPVSK